nr:MAG TPA: hypothetical protein [Caudoviricetes sp.]
MTVRIFLWIYLSFTVSMASRDFPKRTSFLVIRR